MSEEELDQNVLRNGLKRMKKFAEKIQVSNVRVLVDAEYRKGYSNFRDLDLPLNLMVENLSEFSIKQYKSSSIIIHIRLLGSPVILIMYIHVFASEKIAC